VNDRDTHRSAFRFATLRNEVVTRAHTGTASAHSREREWERELSTARVDFLAAQPCERAFLMTKLHGRTKQKINDQLDQSRDVSALECLQYAMNLRCRPRRAHVRAA